MAKTRKTTKAFMADAAPTVGGTKTVSETSPTVGRGMLSKSLSPRQAFEASIHCRKAVNSIVDQITKASRRLFSRSTGAEITSGDAYDFVHHQVTAHYIREIASWWNLEGEMATVKVMEGTRLSRLIALDPGYLQPFPYNARALEFIESWKYLDGRQIDGVSAMIEINPKVLAFAKNWNPNSRIRGSSPAVTGAVEISTNYFQGRFNKSYFENGAVADLIVRFPKGTNEKVAQDFVDRWTSSHSIASNKGFRVAFAIGDSMDIAQLGPNQKDRDGAFLNLRTANAEDIAGLWGVPAALMGFYSKTRFDTYADELEGFFENTLMPNLTAIDAYVQHEIIDPHFPSARSSKKSDLKMGKRLRKAFERAADEHPESEIVFVLDPDSLPIMAKLRKQQLEAATEYRKSLGVSFAVAADWAGLDRPANACDSMIFIDSTQQRIDKLDEQPTTPNDPSGTAPTTDPTDDEPREPLDENDEPTESTTEPTEEEKAFRTMVLDAVAQGRNFAKREALALFDNDLDKARVHEMFLAVKGIVKNGAMDGEGRRGAAEKLFQ